MCGGSKLIKSIFELGLGFAVAIVSLSAAQTSQPVLLCTECGSWQFWSLFLNTPLLAAIGPH